MSPVERSKLKRNGLRIPSAQISSSVVILPANGFDGGIAYGEPESTSMRRILPRHFNGFCARSAGSQKEPPSPSGMYRYPSGPNLISPPLWVANGWMDEGARGPGSESGR